jgi:hypothetical protein
VVEDVDEHDRRGKPIQVGRVRVVCLAAGAVRCLYSLRAALAQYLVQPDSAQLALVDEAGGAWYPTRHGIPRGTVSHTARYPTRHGIPRGMVSHAARYPCAMACASAQWHVLVRIVAVEPQTTRESVRADACECARSIMFLHRCACKSRLRRCFGATASAIGDAPPDAHAGARRVAVLALRPAATSTTESSFFHAEVSTRKFPRARQVLAQLCAQAGSDVRRREDRLPAQRSSSGFVNRAL